MRFDWKVAASGFGVLAVAGSIAGGVAFASGTSTPAHPAGAAPTVTSTPVATSSAPATIAATSTSPAPVRRAVVQAPAATDTTTQQGAPVTDPTTPAADPATVQTSDTAQDSGPGVVDGAGVTRAPHPTTIQQHPTTAAPPAPNAPTTSASS